MQWVNTDLLKLIHMWEDGISIHEIAKTFSTTDEAITNRIQFLIEQGVKIRKWKRDQKKWHTNIDQEETDYE